jgi:hypothetical protein
MTEKLKFDWVRWVREGSVPSKWHAVDETKMFGDTFAGTRCGQMVWTYVGGLTVGEGDPPDDEYAVCMHCLRSTELARRDQENQ